LSSGHGVGVGAGSVALKMEPGILHVQCRDVSAAKWLLQVALRAGFRESGLVLSDSAKVMLAIRTTSNCLELPVAVSDESGTMRTLVPPEYLSLIVEQANAKFEANAARLDRLYACFEDACKATETAACVVCDEGIGEAEANGAKSSREHTNGHSSTPNDRGHWQVALQIRFVPRGKGK